MLWEMRWNMGWNKIGCGISLRLDEVQREMQWDQNKYVIGAGMGCSMLNTYPMPSPVPSLLPSSVYTPVLSIIQSCLPPLLPSFPNLPFILSHIPSYLISHFKIIPHPISYLCQYCSISDNISFKITPISSPKRTPIPFYSHSIRFYPISYLLLPSHLSSHLPCYANSHPIPHPSSHLIPSFFTNQIPSHLCSYPMCNTYTHPIFHTYSHLLSFPSHLVSYSIYSPP